MSKKLMLLLISLVVTNGVMGMEREQGADLSQENLRTHDVMLARMKLKYKLSFDLIELIKKPSCTAKSVSDYLWKNGLYNWLRIYYEAAEWDCYVLKQSTEPSKITRVEHPFEVAVRQAMNAEKLEKKKRYEVVQALYDGLKIFYNRKGICAAIQESTDILFEAAYKGDVEMIQYLCKIGFDPNKEHSDLNESPIHDAARHYKGLPNLETDQGPIGVLVRCGADPKKKDFLGRMYADLILENQRVKIVSDEINFRYLGEEEEQLCREQMYNKFRLDEFSKVVEQQKKDIEQEEEMLRKQMFQEFEQQKPEPKKRTKHVRFADHEGKWMHIS